MYTLLQHTHIITTCIHYYNMYTLLQHVYISTTCIHCEELKIFMTLSVIENYLVF